MTIIIFDIPYKMKLHFIASLVLAASIFAACDDTTNDIGASLTPESDYLSISTDTFEITSQSLVADSVLSKNSTGYLGKIKDPETLTDITCHFMTQFQLLKHTDAAQYAGIEAALKKVISARHQDMLQLNLNAVNQGYNA